MVDLVEIAQHARVNLDNGRTAEENRNRTRLRIVVSFVAAVVAAQWAARVIAHLLVPGLSTATDLLVETVAVAIALGGTAWRLVYLPMSLRAAVVTSSRHVPVEAARARHLRLVD